MANSDFGVVRVDLARLDRLLNLVGELVITRSTFVDQARRARAQYGFKEQILNLVATTERVGRIGEEIQAKIIKARLVPVGTIFTRFEPLVLELSKTSDKEIRLEIDGEDTEVDKRTIDELSEPLVHLVRNALDHGIEPGDIREQHGKPRHGTIRLSASHEGNRLVVTVKDDGAGIDRERVRQRAVERGLLSADEATQLDDAATVDLLFRPGFSTRRELSEMSGRGVGLDAAKRRIELLGGRLTMTSELREGATARIDLPLTTAIVKALMVGVGDEVYALPLDHVREILRADTDAIAFVEGHEIIDLRGEALSLVHLRDLVEMPGVEAEGGSLQIVVIRCGERQIGLAVDRILERHDIVIKAMGSRLSGTRGMAGASIAGDGTVVLVLDVVSLCEQAIVEAADGGTRE